MLVQFIIVFVHTENKFTWSWVQAEFIPPLGAFKRRSTTLQGYSRVLRWIMVSEIGVNNWYRTQHQDGIAAPN